MQSRTAVVSVVLLCVGLLASTPGLTLSGEPVVPATVQAVLTVRILEYDRSLTRWNAGRDRLVVGVVSKARGDADPYSRAIDGLRAQGLRLSPAEHVYRDAASLGRWIDREGIGLLYLSADLAGEAEAAIAAATSRNLRSIAVTREHFRAGATLGMVIRDGRPHILVHLPQSKAAGMDLDPKLLQLAEVVR